MSKTIANEAIRTFWNSEEYAKDLQNSLEVASYIKVAAAYIFDTEIFQRSWKSKFKQKLKGSIFYCDLSDKLTNPYALASLMGYEILNNKVIGDGELAKVFAVKRENKLHAKVIGCYKSEKNKHEIFHAYYGSSNISKLAQTSNIEVNARISRKGLALERADQFLSSLFDEKSFLITRSRLQQYLLEYNKNNKIHPYTEIEPSTREKYLATEKYVYDHKESILSIISSGYFRPKLSEKDIIKGIKKIGRTRKIEFNANVVIGNNEPMPFAIRKDDASYRFDSILFRDYIIHSATKSNKNNTKKIWEKISALKIHVSFDDDTLYISAD